MSGTMVASATHSDGNAKPSRAAKRSVIKSILIASSGNIVEWFDFFAYAFTALYFAPAFFPSGDPTTQLLNTAGIFAAGFFMRPLGGWLFGRIADRRGRKTSMVLSVLLMCFGSLMIACLPTYASIGLWAAGLLLVARLLQGLSVGGEYGTFTSYMQKYLVNSAHLDAKVASHVMTGVLFIFMCIQPLFGALSDRVGRRISMIAYGLFFTFATVPLMTAIGTVQDAGTAFLLALLALLGMSFYTSISGLVKAEMFPPQVRALAVGLPYAIANATFGGTAEFAALSFKVNGRESHFFWYVAAMGAVVLMCALAMPDERKHGHLRNYL